MKNWLNNFGFLIVKAFFLAIGSLPRSLQTAIAGALGHLLYVLSADRRQITVENLNRAFGTEKSISQIKEITRHVFTNLWLIIFEIGWAMRLREKDFSRFFIISGKEHYEKAAARGKGCLLLLGHFGNWELLPIVAHMVGMPAHMLYRPIGNSVFDKFFKENRSRFGGIPIPTHIGAMQKAFRALRKGKAVGILVDQSEGWRHGIFVDFFGHRTCTNPGMARLALKSGAPVLPLFLRREGKRFHAEFGPVLDAVQTGDPIKDLDENTSKYNQIIESYARRYPDQWFWVHDRWKTKPFCPWPDPIRRDKWYKGHAKGESNRDDFHVTKKNPYRVGKIKTNS